MSSYKEMELITMTDMYGDDRADKSMYSGVRAIQALRCDAGSVMRHLSALKCRPKFRRRAATRTGGATLTGIEMPA